MRNYSGLPDDILYEFCITAPDTKSLTELSCVNSRTRRVAMPTLFRSVEYRAKEWDRPWEILLEKLRALLSSKEISFAVRRFVLTSNIWPAYEHPIPGAVLHRILSGFPKLGELHLALQLDYRAAVQVPSDLIDATLEIHQTVNESDKAKALKLPPLHSVTIPSAAWLCLGPLFPNLCSLEILHRDSSLDDISSDSGAYADYKYVSELYPNLKRLHTADPPLTDVVKEIEKYFPHIEDLGLLGGIEEDSKGGILYHLPNFNRFTNLINLSLINAGELDLGFPWPQYEYGLNAPNIEEIFREGQEEVLKSIIEKAETTIIQDGRSPDRCVLQHLKIGDTEYRQNKGKLILVK